VLAEMEKHDLPLLLHGEVTDATVDVFDREAVFIERHLAPLARAFPKLRLVLEHVTTREGVAFVEQAGSHIAATITAHHLLLNRNDMFAGGIRPHAYCLPVLKREEHRLALVRAATGGNPKYFLGTDSAPHGKRTKETACGCAGVYTAHSAIELYAEVFETVGALDRLEAFASYHGADFYRLPRNTGKVTLVREPWTVPHELEFGDDVLVPMRAGETLAWRLAARQTEPVSCAVSGIHPNRKPTTFNHGVVRCHRRQLVVSRWLGTVRQAAARQTVARILGVPGRQDRGG
jgi:dihydroorotase